MKCGSDSMRAAQLWPPAPRGGGMSSCSHAPGVRSGKEVVLVWKGKMLTPAAIEQDPPLVHDTDVKYCLSVSPQLDNWQIFVARPEIIRVTGSHCLD